MNHSNILYKILKFWLKNVETTSNYSMVEDITPVALTPFYNVEYLGGLPIGRALVDLYTGLTKSFDTFRECSVEFDLIQSAYLDGIEGLVLSLIKLSSNSNIDAATMFLILDYITYTEEEEGAYHYDSKIYPFFKDFLSKSLTCVENGYVTWEIESVLFKTVTPSDDATLDPDTAAIYYTFQNTTKQMLSHGVSSLLLTITRPETDSITYNIYIGYSTTLPSALTSNEVIVTELIASTKLNAAPVNPVVATTPSAADTSSLNMYIRSEFITIVVQKVSGTANNFYGKDGAVAPSLVIYPLAEEITANELPYFIKIEELGKYTDKNKTRMKITGRFTE